MPGHSRSWSTFVWNFYLQPTFRSRVLVLTWANWLNCPYINNPNTLAGSRPLLTTPVTVPPSSCLPYLTFQSSAISNIFENTPTQELTFPSNLSHNKYFFNFFGNLLTLYSSCLSNFNTTIIMMVNIIIIT